MQQIPIIHATQQHILEVLSSAEVPMRFSDLRPDDSVENDSLNYHLKQLRSYEWIEKVEDGGYRLSKKGKFVIEDALGLGSMRHRAETFKLYALCLFLRKDKGKYQVLLRKRARHPFYGNVGVWGASVKRGETSEDAIIRRFHSQLSMDIEIEDLQYLASARRISKLEEGELFSDHIFTIHLFNKLDRDIDLESRHTDGVYWAPLSEAIESIENNDSNVMTVTRILKDIEANGHKELSVYYDQQERVVTSY